MPTYNGKRGNDTITGSNRDDFISGREGNDTLYGGGGNDDMFGGTGNDRLYGQAGNDFIRGEAGDDYLDGGDGRDTLVGGDGNDVLYDLVGDDNFYGGAGNDAITGGAGANELSGDAGADVLTGGAGIDTFYFNSQDQAVAGDLITDFEVGIDRMWGGIDFGDANASIAGRQLWEFVGSTAGAALSSGNGQATVTYVGGQTILQLYNNDGDLNADFVQAFSGTIAATDLQIYLFNTTSSSFSDPAILFPGP